MREYDRIMAEDSRLREKDRRRRRYQAESRAKGRPERGPNREVRVAVWRAWIRERSED